MELRMNPDVPFEEIQKAVVEKFTDAAGFFKNARMAISFTGRTLTATEEEILIQTITETTGVELLCIIDQDEKKELMYRSIVEQTLSNIQKREGQFYKGTLRKRQVLESESSIVILGDVEPGAKVVSKGNIVIVGDLYGSVHAGAYDNRDAYIVALSMQPKRLCIGDIESKRQLISQESLNVRGPKIAVVDGGRIYLDPLTD